MSRTRALTTLARPRMLPLVWMAVFFGFMLGHWEAGVHFRGGLHLALVMLSWTALHVGTMWLNSARDRDTGPVAFGESVAVPPHTARFAYFALLITLLASVLGGPIIAACGLLTVVLSVLYSHPTSAWKGHPIGGPFVNIVGYGILTPLAGLTAALGGVSPRTIAVFTMMALAMAGLYFAAQAFQADEDRARGDRTLVATHGPAVVLRTTRILFGTAVALALAGMAIGWFPLPCLIALPFVWRVDRHLVAWSRTPGGGSPHHAKVLVQRLVVLLAVLVTAAVTEHIYDLLQGELPAGLNTRRVPEPWFTLR